MSSKKDNTAPDAMYTKEKNVKKKRYFMTKIVSLCSLFTSIINTEEKDEDRVL